MGTAVLAHLAQLTPLPDFNTRYPDLEEGFVAGQAVASAVSELFFDGLGVVYNDVDVFLLSKKFETTAPQLLRTLDFESIQLETCYQRITATASTVYEVKSTARNGLLNEVLCRPAVLFKNYPEVTSKLFLQSFDLNCVQVGVRLSDRALVWTPAFEAFLAQREMLVMNVKTPVHTAIRWFRKKAELEGVYGHDDKTMELLGAMSHRLARGLAMHRDPTENVMIRRTLRAQSHFGPTYAAKAQSVASALGKYFDIQAVAHGKIVLHTLAPRFEPRQELMSDRVPDIVLPTYARALQGHWKRHTCARLLLAFAKPPEHLSRQNVMVYGLDAVSDDISPSQSDWVHNQMEQHPNLNRFIVGFVPRMQLAFLRELENLSRTEGRWAYGAIEWLSAEAMHELLAATQETLPAVLRKVFEQKKAEYEADAAKAVPVKGAVRAEFSFQGYRVQELSTFKSLCEEGLRMHHCVAGYFTGVTSATCRILPMRKHRAQESLTLELRPSGQGWFMAQLRGLQNRKATDAEHKAAVSLVLALNVRVLLARMHWPVSMATVLRLCEKHPALATKLCTMLCNRPASGYVPKGLSQRLKASLLRACRVPPPKGYVRRLSAIKRPETTFASSWGAVLYTGAAALSTRLGESLGLLKPPSVDPLQDFDDDIAF